MQFLCHCTSNIMHNFETYIVVITFQITMDLSYLFLLNLIPAEIVPLIDIFKYKNIQNVVNFHCSKVETAIFVQKVFNENQILMANPKASSNNSVIPLSYPRIGLILNTACDGWASIFQTMNTRNSFKSPFNWYIVTEDMTSTMEVLFQYPIELDSDVTVLHKINNTFDINEVYNTGFYTQGKFVIQNVGVWNRTLHLKKHNRMDLTGVVLRGTVVITQKVVGETFEEYVERSRLSKSDTLHKLKYFTLLKYLRDMYNFSYALRRTSSWGYLHNDSFDGMIGTLQRNEADIGMSPVFFRRERARVLDATIEVWPSRPVFILRHPKHPGGYSTIFTRPLATKVWCCLVGVLTLAGAFLCFLCRLRALRRQGDDDDSSASLAVLTIWSAICQQGSSLSRDSTSIKLVIFVTFLFCLTIYQYYNAMVVSTLLREPPKNIRTPKDLLRSNLKAGVHDVLYNKDFFKRTTDPIALEMYNKKIVTATEQNFFALEDGMAMVKRGGFAFLVDCAIAYGIMRNTFNERELCEAHEIALYPPQNMVAVVRKGSPYREHFAHGLRKMFETGLMRRLRAAWDEPRPGCVRTPDTALISVSLREFSAALAALAAGAGAAAAGLAAELAARRGHR